MPTPETETKKNFCEFADWSWFSFFERNFYEVVAVFNATETDWDIITFDKSPAAALVIVSRHANYFDSACPSMRRIFKPRRGAYTPWAGDTLAAMTLMIINSSTSAGILS